MLEANFGGLEAGEERGVKPRCSSIFGSESKLYIVICNGKGRKAVVL